MRSGPLCPAGLLLVCALGAPEAAAQSDTCRVIDLDMTPTPDLQIVAWIEDAQGTYVDTAFITRTTGSYGLGNRPGIMEFNSGPLWPYGRRITTFPVWAGRHGMSWPLVLFQDGADNNLSHSIVESSRERFYCRPIEPDEPMWDAQSCASMVFTDKGVLTGEESSRYPPRSDITVDPAKDHPSVEQMAALNPFDGVSHATPRGDGPFSATWAVPPELPMGSYVLWLEVSREFDHNETYSVEQYPSPPVTYSSYGEAYRGQPSIVYRIDFTLSADRTVATALDYFGYGDPDGLDGEIRPPDSTISAGPSGSGASRLLVTTDGGQMFRVRVSAYGSDDRSAPDSPGAVSVDELQSTEVAARFAAPGDDGLEGTVAGYEVRYLAGREIDEASFSEGTPATYDGTPVAGGEQQTMVVSELLPRTNYSIGIRAFDECANAGPVRTFSVTTPRPEAGEVDACFVATAAYGSLLAGEVSLLRLFRDMALRSNVPGELAVESYYTFGPLLARIIAPSETLRRAARAALAPVLDELHASGF